MRIPTYWEVSKIRERGKEEFFKSPGVIKTSKRGLRTGIVADYYIDFDNGTVDPFTAADVVSLYVIKINEILRQRSIDYLGFIEKDAGGTVGAVKAALAISIMTKIPNILIKLGKELEFERVKLQPISDKWQLGGSRFILITDHCTTGREAIKAVSAIEKNGGIVTDVVAYTSRSDRIKTRQFEERNITFHSIYNLPEDLKNVGIDIESKIKERDCKGSY